MELIFENERVYARDAGGKLLAEVTFPLRGGVYHINHTYVASELRGQGVADRLLHGAADVIQKAGGKAVASCSYAAGWFPKHPEYAGLLADGP